jgi:hypothetical protein
VKKICKLISTSTRLLQIRHICLLNKWGISQTIDWFIDYCLTPCEKYSSYFQDENNFNNKYKLLRNEGWMD